MIRNILGALAALLLLAPPALAQTIINPPGGSGGAAACVVATPCTVTQKFAPATNVDGLVINMPSGATGNSIDFQLNGARKAAIDGALGSFFARDYRAAIGRGIGWATDTPGNGGIDRNALFGGGSSGCTAQFIFSNDFNQTNYFVLNPVSSGGPMQVGNCDSATPASRTIQTENVVAGTSNTAGASSFIIQGSKGTGTGNGGDIVLRTSPPTTTGSTQNAGVDGFTVLGSTTGVKFGGGQVIKVRVVTAAGAVTVATTDYLVVVNKTSGAATTVNLPASPTTGQAFIIKDGKADAATNNITLTPAAGNIDGAATFVMATNKQWVMIAYDGTQWEIIG